MMMMPALPPRPASLSASATLRPWRSRGFPTQGILLPQAHRGFPLWTLTGSSACLSHAPGAASERQVGAATSAPVKLSALDTTCVLDSCTLQCLSTATLRGYAPKAISFQVMK